MIKRVFLCAAAVAAVIAIGQSCTKNNTEELSKIDEGGITVTDTISYATDIKPLMVTYCYGVDGQGCHISATTTSANGNFENYAGLKAKVDNGSINSRVFVAKNMPASYSTGPTQMTLADLNIFKAWVDQGAQDN